MQDVSQAWKDTNADAFTVRSYITIWIERNSRVGALGISPDRIISYSQGFTGDMLAGEIPEIHATVKVDNSDGYFSRALLADGENEYDHAKTDIHIAFELIDEGEVAPESINGGRLFVSEVSFDAKDHTATIKFADILQFMNTEYKGEKEDYAENIISAVVDQALLENVVPLNVISTVVSPIVAQYWKLKIPDGATLAEALQLCANARNCALFVDRNSAIHIEPIDRQAKDYTIGREVQYVNPSISKDKSINSVLVRFVDEQMGIENYEYRRQDQIGAQQTVMNPAVQGIFNAMSVARRTYRTLQENRTVISGEFRCDPRVDIFDCIQIAANKRDLLIADLELLDLNTLESMTIQELEETSIDIGTYCLYALEMEFSGAWHGRFTARAVDEKNNANLQSWGDMKALTWGKAKEFSWDEVRGGYYG